MQTIKSVVYLAGMVWLIFITVFALLAVYPFSEKIFYKCLRAWSYVSMRWLEITCCLYYEVEGKENIPAKGAYIILSRHQSAWETVALQEIFTGPYIWVIKRSLLWVPFFGWALAMQKSIGIDRAYGKKALRQLVEVGTGKLKSGYKIIIFPEGTRVEPNSIGKFRIGGSMLAAESGFPIVPVSHNAGKFWHKRSIAKLPGTVKVIIGKPITSTGKSVSEINEEVLQWMVNNKV